MARRMQATVSSQAASSTLPINYRAKNFGVSFSVNIGGGTMTYTVQHTLSDLQNGDSGAVWIDHSSIAGETTNTDGNYAFPITGIRVNVTAYTSGTATLTVLQND